MASGFKIISGGQNGADRIALEVAQEFGIPTGGTAPKGFRTSKGYDVSLRYAFHLKESKSWSYPSRTMQNVDDADATLIFQSRDSTGTKKTLGYCMTGKWVCPKRIPPIQPHRPYIIVDLLAPNANEMIEKVQGFIREKVQTTLNVAGHTNVDGCEWNMLLRTFLRQVLVPFKH